MSLSLTFIDLMCPECGYMIIDFHLRRTMRPLPFTCPCCKGKTLAKVWLKAPGVIGDEVDITIRHGLCDPKTHEPVRYRSKSEIRRAAKMRNLTNIVEHKGRAGGDKNKNTQRFI